MFEAPSCALNMLTDVCGLEFVILPRELESHLAVAILPARKREEVELLSWFRDVVTLFSLSRVLCGDYRDVCNRVVYLVIGYEVTCGKDDKTVRVARVAGVAGG